jgi:hypothetical protein
MPKLTRVRKGIVCTVFLSAMACVGVLVHSYNTVPSGYVAVYPVLVMWIITLLVTVLAGILVAIPRTRFVGFAFAAAIVFIPSSFILGVKVSEIAGLNHWRNAPMHRFGPDVPCSLVVYYQPGASRRQIEQSSIRSSTNQRMTVVVCNSTREYENFFALPRSKPTATVVSR